MRFPVLHFLAVFSLASFTMRAADPHPSIPAIGSLDGLGVNIHFTDPKPGELEMITAAGFKWVRMDFSWGGTERKSGEYDFSAYDRLVAALERNGLRAVFILDYGNSLYDDGASPHTDEGRAAFARWAATVVRRYAGKGFLWEMWNEPNIAQFWKPKPDVQQYVALAKRVAAELKKEGLIDGPEAKNGNTEAFIGSASSTIDLSFLEGCFKGGLLEDWSAVSVHPYRQKAPETVEDEYRNLRLLIRRYAPEGKVIPILSGEWGYSTAWSSLGKDEVSREETQAKYLPRMFLTNIANNIPLSIWYDWKDDGDDPKEGEHRFGIVRRKYREGEKEVFEPKPAYRAMQTFTQQLAGARLRNTESLPPGQAPKSRMLVFEKNGLIHFALTWHPDYLLESSGLGSFSVGGLPATDSQGILVPAGPGGGESSTIHSGLAPYYFAPETASDSFRVLAASPRLPLEITWHWPVQDPARDVHPDPSTIVMINNPLNHSLAVRDGGAEQNALQVPPGGKATLNQIRGFNDFITSSLRKWKDRQTTPKTCRLGIDVSVGKEEHLSIGENIKVVCENPLGFTALPPGNSELVFRIENQSGEALSGVATIEPSGSSVPGNRRFQSPFAFKQNDRELFVRVPTGPIKEAGQFIGRIENDPANPAYYLDTRCVFARMDSDLLAKAKVRGDGDSKVKGEGVVTLAEPAVGLCPSLTAAARLSYRFEKGWKFLQLTSTASNISGPARESDAFSQFKIWLHGDGKGCQPRIRFKDSTGQTFQSDGLKIDFTGWRVAEFPMRSSFDRPLAHWGGANDGEIHYPITWDTIFLLDNVSKEPVEGEIYLSAPTLFH